MADKNHDIGNGRAPGAVCQFFPGAALVAAAVAVAVSCTRDAPLSPSHGGDASCVLPMVRAVVSVPPVSPASGDYGACEDAVRSVRFLSFDASGALTDGATATSGMSAVVGCRTGSVSIHAVANGPDLSSVSTEGGLESFPVRLSDNSLEAFVMEGSATAFASGSFEVSVSLRRLVCRVAVSRIRCADTLRDFTLSGLWLDNVPEAVALGTHEPLGGLLDGSVDNGDAANGLISDLSAAADLADGRATGRDYGFYPLPGDSVRLCMAVRHAGGRAVYAACLPPLEAGRSYLVTDVALVPRGEGTKADFSGFSNQPIFINNFKFSKL